MALANYNPNRRSILPALLSTGIRAAYNNPGAARRAANQVGSGLRSAYDYIRNNRPRVQRRQNGLRQQRFRVNRAQTMSAGRPSNAPVFTSSNVRGKRFRKRRFRKKFGRKRGGLSKLLWRSLCCPQTVTGTFSTAKQGVQGQRTWYGMALGGYGMLYNLIVPRKPSNFLFNQSAVRAPTWGGTASSTATLQDLGQDSWKCTIKSLMMDARIQNRSNAAMELKIYECVIRRDVGNSAFGRDGASWQTYFEYDMNPTSTVGTGNLGPNQDVLPTGLSKMWGAPTFTPYMSNEFVNFFKIVKTHSLRLGPNEIVNRKFYCMNNKRLKGEYLNSTMSTEWQRGYTKYFLFSWVGMPVDDGTTAKQSKASCDLFVQADYRMKFHFWPGLEPLYNIDFDAAPNVFTNQTSTYKINPADIPTPIIGATETVQVPPSGAGTTEEIDPV